MFIKKKSKTINKSKLLIGASALVTPTLGHAQTTLIDIVSTYTAVLALMVNLSIAIALAVFIWGVVTFIAKSGDDKQIAAGKKRMIWGVIGLFVIVSVWGLVMLLNQLFGVPADDQCVNPGFTFDGSGTITGVRTCF